MLELPERSQVKQALENELLHAADLKAFLTTVFAPDEQPVLVEVDAGPPGAHAYAGRVMRFCLRDRWNRNPSMMQRLLDELVLRGNAALALIAARVKQGIDPVLSPLNSSWFTAERPFFGRADIRTTVQALLNAGDKPILQVLGPEKSGKTYTSEWLDYQADENRCDFRFVVESLEKGSGPSISPDVLAESLVAKMGQPVDGMPVPTAQRYVKRLCSWLISKALQAGGKTWILLDGFDDPDLDRDTSALIQELAGSLLTGELNRRVRLILVDFKSNLAQVDPLRIALDPLPKPDEVKAGDLLECLTQHFADIKKEVETDFMDALAAKLVAEADELKTKDEFKTTPRLKLLNLVVYRLRQQDLKRAGRIV